MSMREKVCPGVQGVFLCLHRNRSTSGHDSAILGAAVGPAPPCLPSMLL